MTGPDIILAVNVLSELSLLYHELNPTFSLLIYSTVLNIIENNKEYIEDELKELKIFILTNCIEQLTALRKYGMMAECLKVLQKLLFGDEYLLSKVYELFYAILSSSGLPEYLCTFENINGTNTHYMPRIVYESHNGNAEWFEIRRSLIEKSIIDSLSLLPYSDIRFLNFNANILKRVLDKIQEVTKRARMSRKQVPKEATLLCVLPIILNIRAIFILFIANLLIYCLELQRSYEFP
ncbi:hypothetical protein O9G_000518 [Rozella allomycis CSF55]|uniref:Uncharacterized protein n=1 Tax=Rozella allomycis (strain CSF55) TaxID=988480 RepID=A0A075AVH7_ROZAC|nr:hypothetical protein O9G_000518 [Rozella allomycis CSF55]|eukprot:EPZ34331.1 hypothetical protein O9G_000518 [Rozella allomycis CSF55]